LLTEIFFSFTVLFGVGALLVNYGRNYVLPRGFHHENVWRLNIGAGRGEKMPRPVLDDVLRHVRALPGVEEISLTSPNTPFRFLTMNGEYSRGNRKANLVDGYDADDRYDKALGLTLREGRWFRASDDAATHRPVVISKKMRDALFSPHETAVGQLINYGAGPVNGNDGERLVVGVADDVRAGGDFDAPNNAAWARLVPYDTTQWEGAAVLVRVAPGQGAALQQRIVRTVASLTRQWSTQVRTLEADRVDKLRVTLAPLAGMAIVGVFLIVNVALGLFGMLWYNISQRRAEIGLRRALGATGPGIGRQFLGEMLVLTTLGVLAGVLLAVQFPLLNAFDVEPRVYVISMMLATAMIFVVAAVCAWQPSRLAAAIHPAAALREE
jgi:putative ABC transport system permease protein